MGSSNPHPHPHLSTPRLYFVFLMSLKIGSVRWRGGRLAFSEVKCLKGLFIHRTELRQRLNIGGVEFGGRESPEVGRMLMEDCKGLRSANYDHGWSVSPWWQTGSRCELNISTWMVCHVISYCGRWPHYFGYLGYLFPYCQPTVLIAWYVCHVLSNVRDGWIDKLSEYGVTCEV